MTRRIRPYRLPILIATFVLSACATGAPPTDPLIVEVVSEPQPVEVALRGRTVGSTPVRLTVGTLPEALDIAAVGAQPPVVERRVKILGQDHVRISFHLGDQPSTIAQVLGLTDVIVFEYGEHATFDTDSFDVKPSLLPMLERQAKVLDSAFAGLEVYVCGHTDATGGEQHNQVLSIRRARAVADFLVQAGVDEERLHVQGFGPDYPLAPNDSAERRALNRRTEIVLPDE